MKKTLVLATALASVGCFAWGAGLAQDTFEGYADQAAFVASWPGTTPCTLGTDGQGYAGSAKYAIQNATAQRCTKAISLTPTDDQPVTFEYFVKIPAAASNSRHFCNIANGATYMVTMGYYNTAGWSTRVLPGPSWQSTGANTGGDWVGLKAVITSSNVNFFVNDTALISVPTTTGSQFGEFTAVNLGSALSSSGGMSGFYDNISVVQANKAGVGDWNLY